MATFVIGDVHGCLEELDELLGLIDSRRTNRLVFVGDLVDRGPDPAGVVRRVRERGYACVMGNHDEKHVRWAKHEARRKSDTSYRNPMTPFSPERQRQHAEIGEDGIAFLASLPLTIDLGDGWFVAHAGAAPNRAWSAQKPAVYLRCRWVDAAGTMIGSATAPPGGVHWASAWRGPENVIYGHHVHDLANIKTDRAGTVTCVGIDTGCCFGGRLTAYEVASGEVVQVRARRTYAELRAEDEA